MGFERSSSWTYLGMYSHVFTIYDTEGMLRYYV